MLCGIGIGFLREGKEVIVVEKVFIFLFMIVVVFFLRVIDIKLGMKVGNLMIVEKVVRVLNLFVCVEFCWCV